MQQKTESKWKEYLSNTANIIQLVSSIPFFYGVLMFLHDVIMLLIGKPSTGMNETITICHNLLPYFKAITLMAIGIGMFLFGRAQKSQDKGLLTVAQHHVKLRENMAVVIFSNEFKIQFIMHTDMQGVGSPIALFNIKDEVDYVEKRLQKFFPDKSYNDITKLVNDFYNIKNESDRTKEQSTD